MQRSRRDIESALSKKGFARVEGDHSWFVYYSLEGKKTIARTKTSHGGGGKSIGDPLLSAMAKQCHITKQQFVDLVDCPLSREAYESALLATGSL